MAKTSKRAIGLMEVPDTEEAAEQLLLSLGYSLVSVYRREDDRILFTAGEVAFTLCLDFDQEREKVHLRTLKGWPV